MQTRRDFKFFKFVKNCYFSPSTKDYIAWIIESFTKFSNYYSYFYRLN
jgi:hypothetical protein